MASLIQVCGDVNSLSLQWSDGVEARIPWRVLRDRCPCANCLNPPAPVQDPGTSLLPVLTFAETLPLKATAMHPMGNYAYSIHFSDGHNTGIYSLEFLRQLTEESGVAP